MNRSRPLTVIVTGGASGLGAAIVAKLHADGHLVRTYDIKNGDDVSMPASWLKDVDVDVLVNCAGINHNEWFSDVTPDSLARIMEVNAFGPVLMTKACLSALEKNRGIVINIVSNAATIPMTSSLAYNMSKAAALMATKQMAHELTPNHGITVFSISPNKLSGTEMSRQIEENVLKVRGWTPEYAAAYQKKALMHGQETDPIAIAEMIGSLLATGGAKYMSGCDIPFGK